jgi:hypothetical protein
VPALKTYLAVRVGHAADDNLTMNLYFTQAIQLVVQQVTGAVRAALAAEE